MIKKINPFIIIGILLFISLSLWISVHNKRSNIHDKNKQLASFEQKAKNLKNLKRRWNQKNIEAKLRSILSDPEIINASTIKKQANKITMKVNKISKNQIDRIIKNLLNEPFDIKKFSIDRANKDYLDFYLEVAI